MTDVKLLGVLMLVTAALGLVAVIVGAAIAVSHPGPVRLLGLTACFVGLLVALVSVNQIWAGEA